MATTRSAAGRPSAVAAASSGPSGGAGGGAAVAFALRGAAGSGSFDRSQPPQPASPARTRNPSGNEAAVIPGNLYCGDRMVPLVTKDFRRTTLRPQDRPLVRSLAEALFSPNGEASPERLDAFVDDVDAFMSPASKTLRFGLVAMLHILRWSPLFFLRFRLFDTMTVPERVEHLERLDRSKVKQLPLIVVAYKTVLTMLFYEDEEELRGLGYPGKERKRYLNVLPASPPPRAPASETEVTS
jgi:hypothetical protein